MEKIYNLAFSGGGIHGICFLGAIQVLEERELLDIKRCSGSSVGAFGAALFAAGYTSKELIEFVMTFNFSKIIVDLDLNNMLEKFGFDTGARVVFVFKKLLERKTSNSEITLLELYNQTGVELTIVTSSLSDNKSKYFSYKNYPNMPVWFAVRMSISVPLVFQPVEFENKTYVDAGIFDNYPIHIFDDEMENTVGLTIDDGKSDDTYQSIGKYIYHVINSAIFGNSAQKIEKYQDHTIKIKLQDSLFIDFKIDEPKKKEFIAVGREGALEYLNRRKQLPVKLSEKRKKEIMMKYHLL